MQKYKGKTLRQKLIYILLLSSLLFNIAHASIIAMKDDCHHESVHEYVLEQTQSAECGDLCDMHHLFHFIAIVTSTILQLETAPHKDKLVFKATQHTPPSQKTDIKPPIV